MTPLFVSTSDFERLMSAWSADRPVYVPVTRGGHRHWQRYSPDTPVQAEMVGIRTVEPLKAFYFRVHEKVATYPGGENPFDSEPGFVIVGAKQCDLRSLHCLDQTFAKSDIPDPFWVSRREKALVVGADCSDAAESCFCTLLGMEPHPQDCFDLSLAAVAGGFVLEVGSEKGDRALKLGNVVPQKATGAQVGERDANRERTLKAIKEQNRKYETTRSFTELVASGFSSAAWTPYVGRCREDAACLAICPTCHCFVLYDQRGESSNERIRVWDFCYLRGYTRCGGGHSARATGNDRFKNKYIKKFQFYPAKFDVVACTGCGRCIDACLARIDMRQVLHDLEESRSA